MRWVVTSGALRCGVKSCAGWRRLSACAERVPVSTARRLFVALAVAPFVRVVLEVSVPRSGAFGFVRAAKSGRPAFAVPAAVEVAGPWATAGAGAVPGVTMMGADAALRPRVALAAAVCVAVLPAAVAGALAGAS
ncbi:hypothetical protein PSAC2689_30238 [Paraburkholderia sacchari]